MHTAGNMSKKTIFRISLLFFVLSSQIRLAAQEGEKVFRFLDLPTSTRINALGGANVSLVENDISLVFQNPASLGKEMNMNADITFMSYIADIKSGSAIFGKSIHDNNSFAVGVSYIDYGNFKETSENNEQLGDFSAKDIVVNGIYSHILTDRLRGGVTTKFISSNYADYSSVAIGFDLGLSYYNEDKEFSAGLVLKNIGRQLTSYNDKRVNLPWDVNIGISKKLNNAPIRFSITGVYLTQWKFSRIDKANGIESKDDNFAKTLFKHTVLGVDITPTPNFWVGIGFNPKIHDDLKLQDGNKFGGFNAGAGIRVQKFNVGFSFAKYHPAATSFMFNLGVDISKF